MFKIKLFYFVGAIILSTQVFSQSDCQDDIDEANKLYENGIYKKAADLIKKTLETCALDKTQEDELLKLLISTYYELDELELAEEYVTDFIKRNPYYIPSKKNDTYHFRHAMSKVKIWPSFSTGIRFGVPPGFVTTKKIFPVLDTADYTKDYIVKPILMSALEFSWNITNFIALNAGAGIRMQKIIHQVPQYNQLFFNYEEQTINLNAPFVLQFTLPLNSKFSPAIYFGGEIEYFVEGKYTYYYTGTNEISTDLSFYLMRNSENVVVERDQRNQYRYAALGGVRLLYKLEKFSILADFRYIKEFVLYNNPEKRYANPDLFLTNNYTLSDISLETMDISVGILYNFSYKVKSKY